MVGSMIATYLVQGQKDRNYKGKQLAAEYYTYQARLGPLGQSLLGDGGSAFPMLTNVTIGK